MLGYIATVYSSTCSPPFILPTHDNFRHVEAEVYDFPTVDEIVLAGALVGVRLVGRNAGSDVALDEAAAGDVKVDLDEPELVHEAGGVAPDRLVEGDVVSLEDEEAVVRLDGDVLVLGVLDGVVEARGADGGWRRPREGLAEAADEVQVGGGVEGESGAAAGVGFDGVGEGGELGAG